MQAMSPAVIVQEEMFKDVSVQKLIDNVLAQGCTHRHMQRVCRGWDEGGECQCKIGLEKVLIPFLLSLTPTTTRSFGVRFLDASNYQSSQLFIIACSFFAFFFFFS